MRAIKIFSIIGIIFSLPFSLNAQEKFKYNSKNKRDPFVHLITPDGKYFAPLGRVKGVGDIKLEGIIWDPQGDSFAVINGEIVREGQDLDGIKVKKIFSKKIIILMKNQELTLNLIEEEEEE